MLNEACPATFDRTDSIDTLLPIMSMARTRGKTPGTLMSLICLNESVQRILSNVGLQTAFRWLSGIHKRNLEPMTAISPSVAGRPGATLACAQASSRPRCSKSKGGSMGSCCPGFCPSYTSDRYAFDLPGGAQPFSVREDPGRLVS